MEQPHLKAVGLFQELDHPTEGRIRQARPPARFSATPAGVRRLAPRLGEHTREVLCEIGYSDAEALVAATRTGAEAMMMAGRTGEITEGFLADIIVVAGEPQNDVRLLQPGGNIKLVMKDGCIYKNLLETQVH